MLARPRSQRKTCATIFAPIGPGVSYHEPAVAADTYADGGRCVCRTAHTLRADRNAGTLVESVVVSRPVRCLQTRLSTRRPLTSHSHPHPHIQTQHVHVARYRHDDTKRIKTQLTAVAQQTRLRCIESRPTCRIATRSHFRCARGSVEVLDHQRCAEAHLNLVRHLRSFDGHPLASVKSV